MKRIIGLALLCMLAISSIAFETKADEISRSSDFETLPDNDEFQDTTSPTHYDDVWRFRKRKVMLGFTTGTLDQKRRFGGEISSRWGLSFLGAYNINLHRKPIGGFVKFGLDLGMEVNYMNFAKGSGSFSDIMHPNQSESDDVEFALGRHYLTAGFVIGPNVTFAPFYKFSNRNLAALTFRPYFNVVPSFATYMVSDEEDMEFHNAFAFWCAAGLEIQWKRLIVGFGWKGSTAKYKGMVDDILGSMEDSEYKADSYKFDVNMFNIMIGLAF